MTPVQILPVPKEHVYSGKAVLKHKHKGYTHFCLVLMVCAGVCVCMCLSICLSGSADNFGFHSSDIIHFLFFFLFFHLLTQGLLLASDLGWACWPENPRDLPCSVTLLPPQCRHCKCNPLCSTFKKNVSSGCQTQVPSLEK